MDNPKTTYTKEQLKILRLLAAEYPSIALASATLVNLNALSNLPKGTEHFMSDLHGEAEAFEHILNNCSGVIREKVDTLFYRTMSEESRRTLCVLFTKRAGIFCAKLRRYKKRGWQKSAILSGIIF